jgi:excisionase family DNA binding protein
MEHQIILHNTSIDDLKQIIGEVIREEFKTLSPQSQNEHPEYLTRKEVCQLLQVSEVTLNKWTKTGIVTGYRIKSRVRYKRSEIEESLHQVKSLKYKRQNP